MNITFNWFNPNNGTDDGTRIYRSSTPIPDSPLPTPLATVGPGVSTYTDTTAVAGKKYYYRTAAFKGSEQFLSKNRCVMALFPSQTGHGNQTMRAGDWDLGYFGIVQTAEFITPSSLISRFGIGGVAINQDSLGWVKVAYKGKVLLIPNRSIVRDLKYADLYNAGLVYGTNDNGIAVPAGSTATNQYKPFIVDNTTYIPRLFKGVSSDTATVIKYPMNAIHNSLLTPPEASEWDDIIGAIASAYPRWDGDNAYGGITVIPEFGDAGSGIVSTLCQQTSGHASVPMRGSRAASGRHFTAAWSSFISPTIATTGGQDTPDSANINASVSTVWRPILEVLN